MERLRVTPGAGLADVKLNRAKDADEPSLGEQIRRPSR
jgi:hypothetical protein